MRIGVLKFNNIGDVLLMTPVLRALRRHFPDARITAVVNDFTAAMLHGNPDLDQIIAYPRAYIKSKPKWARLLLEFRFALQILRLRPDMVFNLTPGDRGLLYAWFSGAGIRAGFANANWKPWSWRRKILTHDVFRDPGTHQVIQQLGLLEKVGVRVDFDERMRLVIPPKAVGWAASHGKTADSRSRMIVVHPVARWLYKCWEPVKFARVIDWLQREMGAEVLVTCGPEPREKQRAREILALCRTRPRCFLGTVGIGQLAALIAQSDLFIGIDTAPMHMAAALDRPVVALFGPTREEWEPWCRYFAVVRGTCSCKTGRGEECGELPFRRCMSAIDVEQATQAISSLLASCSGTPSVLGG